MKHRSNRFLFGFTVTFSVLLWILLAGGLLVSCGGAADGAKGQDPAARSKDGAGSPRAKGKKRPGGRPGMPGMQRKVAAVPVMTAVVATDDMEAFLDGSSTLTAEEMVDVVSQATGVVAEVNGEEGDSVRKGKLLARLAYEKLELAERRARSEYERLQANFARSENLVKEQLIPEEDYQQVGFDLARAEIDWQQAKLDLEHTRILSPITGTITTRAIRIGQLVRENDTVYQMVDFGSLVAPVFLPEKYLGSLHVGQPAFLTTPSLGGRKIEGRVLRISPVVDSQSGTVKVTVDLRGAKGLRPGMYAEVQLVLDRHAGVPVIEKRAIVYEDELPHVFVVADGKAEKRSVTLGYQDEDRAEVVSGVAAGEQVVVVGQSALKDGSTVAVGEGAES